VSTPSRAQTIAATVLKRLIETQPFDQAAWTQVCSPDLHLRIANGPVHTRREQGLVDLRDFLSRVSRLGCDFCEMWQRRETIFAETELEFIDAGGRPSKIPCVLVARTTHGLVRDLRIYIDTAGLPLR